MSRVSLRFVAVLVGAWWVTAGALDGWAAGVVGVVLGALAHAGLGGERKEHPRPLRLLAFLPHFVALTLRGGLDVARRALSPSLPLAPRLLVYPVALSPGPARVFFVNLISLMPGTFSARLKGDELTVHVLAYDAHGEEKLHDLEKRVKDLFRTVEERQRVP